MHSFAYIIHSRRRTAGLTQKQLAAAIECDITYVSKIENGRNDYPPSEEIIRKIADVLKLDFDELLLNSGRIDKDTLAIFHELAEKYPQFIPFIHKLAADDTFATNLFRTT